MTVRDIRLVEMIGSGGMGDVYLGIDQRLDRQVAVKAIRPGARLDARARARLLREARVLAQLDHPNICRLHDYVEGGDETDFLILELVHGRSLRERLRDAPSFRQRLSIALQIAGALGAAHALSIVHRDLKPENIMVGDDDHVKILDFGLARSVEDMAGEPERAAPGPAPGPASASTAASATVTRLGDVVGTPRYMSPEQARGEPLTAASDMYSFGLVLQELFTGRPPFPPALDPGELLQRAMWGDTAPVEGLDAHLTALIKRLKSLAAGERPGADAALERLRWLAERPARRLRRIVAGAVAALLVTAAAVSVVGFVRARRAQARAEASELEARRAEQQAEAVSSFLRTMLASADPRAQGRDVRVVDVLDRAAAAVESELADHPLQQAAVRDTLGITYRGLGELEKARQQAVAALALRREALGPRAVETLAALDHLGRLELDRGHGEEAERLLREAVEGRTAALGADNPATLSSLAALGSTLRRLRRWEEAEQAIFAALEGRRRVLGADHLDTLESLYQAGRYLTDERRWQEAETALREVLDERRRLLGVDHPDTIVAIKGLSILFDRQERYDEAEGVIRQALELQRQVLGAEHPVTLNSVTDLGISLIRHHRYDEAVPLLEENLARESRLLDTAHPAILETLRALGYALDQLGRSEAAEQAYRERWERARRALGDEHRVTLQTLSGLGNFYENERRSAEAERIYRRVLETRRRLFGEDDEDTRRSRVYLARLLRGTGRAAEADEIDGTP